MPHWSANEMMSASQLNWWHPHRRQMVAAQGLRGVCVSLLDESNSLSTPAAQQKQHVSSSSPESFISTLDPFSHFFLHSMVCWQHWQLNKKNMQLSANIKRKNYFKPEKTLQVADTRVNTRCYLTQVHSCIDLMHRLDTDIKYQSKIDSNSWIWYQWQCGIS